MPKPLLKFQFDANQPHQLDAIAGVVNLFDGMSRVERAFALRESAEIMPNLQPHQTLREEWLQENLMSSQRGTVIGHNVSDITMSVELAVDDGTWLEGAGTDSFRTSHVTVQRAADTECAFV